MEHSQPVHLPDLSLSDHDDRGSHRRHSLPPRHHRYSVEAVIFNLQHSIARLSDERSYRDLPESKHLLTANPSGNSAYSSFVKPINELLIPVPHFRGSANYSQASILSTSVPHSPTSRSPPSHSPPPHTRSIQESANSEYTRYGNKKSKRRSNSPYASAGLECAYCSPALVGLMRRRFYEFRVVFCLPKL